MKLSGTVAELFLPTIRSMILDGYAPAGDLRGVLFTGGLMVRKIQEVIRAFFRTEGEQAALARVNRYLIKPSCLTNQAAGFV